MQRQRHGKQIPALEGEAYERSYFVFAYFRTCSTFRKMEEGVRTETQNAEKWFAARVDADEIVLGKVSRYSTPDTPTVRLVLTCM